MGPLFQLLLEVAIFGAYVLYLGVFWYYVSGFRFLASPLGVKDFLIASVIC